MNSEEPLSSDLRDRLVTLFREVEPQLLERTRKRAREATHNLNEFHCIVLLDGVPDIAVFEKDKNRFTRLIVSFAPPVCSDEITLPHEETP